jgi:hypothetical protein
LRRERRHIHMGHREPIIPAAVAILIFTVAALLLATPS